MNYGQSPLIKGYKWLKMKHMFKKIVCKIFGHDWNDYALIDNDG